MRKISSCLVLLSISFSAWSQFSVGVGGNYTSFLGDYHQATPGLHTRIQYQKNAYTLGLQYNYHVPFQFTYYGSLDAPSNIPNSTDRKLEFRFQSLDLSLRRSIIHSEDYRTKFYGGLGVSWVLLRYKESYLTAYNGPSTMPLEYGKHGSLRINGLLGGEYSLGRVALYGEAGYALPTEKKFIKQSINIISPYLNFQAGLKLTLQ